MGNYHARCISRAGDSRWRVQGRNILFIVEDAVLRFRFETTLVSSILVRIHSDARMVFLRDDGYSGIARVHHASVRAL